MRLLVQVTAPSFCAGAVFDHGRCIRCAPILKRWFGGRLYETCKAFAKLRQWQWREIEAFR